MQNDAPQSSRSLTIPTSTRPVLVGEVLFDIFPDGQEVLGGAPFNVAWNLHGLGCLPLFISRVGSDRLGNEILEGMRRWGMEVGGVQRDDSHPTGCVRVAFTEGQPSYHIVPDRAYDFIDAEAAFERAADAPAGMLYRGTLAVRTPESAAAVATLHRDLDVPVFVDLNLRAPWWNEAAVATACDGAAVVKLNDQELADISGHRLDGERELVEAAHRLLDRYALSLVVVTRGPDGVLAVTADGSMERCAAGVVEDLQDTVGAGDAFSSVMMVGLFRGWPVARTLRRAAGFAARVCGIRGATTDDPTLYSDTARAWEREDAG